MFRKIVTVVFSMQLAGCAVFAVGEDPSCDEQADGLVCHSAKEVLLMSSYKTDLENLSPEELSALQQKALGYTKNMKTEEEGMSRFFARDDVHESVSSNQNTGPAKAVVTEPPVDTALNVDSFKQMEVLKQAEMLRDEQSIMRTPAKVLRMQFATWEDDEGRLHDPGKIYVEVESRKWAIGKEKRTEMPVITPLQIRKLSLEEIRLRNEGK
ncbi:TraV family lipoprotein [Pseudoalteromonas sp. T1lg23B]|uniref:TraV family lipoprotein n=1 Tax=Pseudoalteromonas sp. T1lg23B TaxID=2077097 RepID=UPI000CF69907|nr:TraV family lipoprotein [Pseudoalteromonas sp. T1lg23B]